jgi:hypothetical protein
VEMLEELEDLESSPKPLLVAVMIPSIEFSLHHNKNVICMFLVCIFI